MLIIVQSVKQTIIYIKVNAITNALQEHFNLVKNAKNAYHHVLNAQKQQQVALNALKEVICTIQHVFLNVQMVHIQTVLK